MVRGTPGKSNSETTDSFTVSQTEDFIHGPTGLPAMTRPQATPLLYLSISSPLSLFSLSSLSLCSRASRLFSANSLVASSGSVVPAEVLGEALAVTRAAGTASGAEAGTGAGAGEGAGAGSRAVAGAAVQTGTKRKPTGSKTHRTKQKPAFPTPRPRIHHYKREC